MRIRPLLLHWLAIIPAITATLVSALVVTGCGSASSAATSAVTSTPALSSTASPSPGMQAFTLDPINPVLPHGAPGGWDGRYIDPGAIIAYQGTLHMFYNGINGYPAPVGIGYATSTDGEHWTRKSAEPVLTSQQVPYAGVTIFVTTGLVTETGTWALYFYTIKTGSLITSPGV